MTPRKMVALIPARAGSKRIPNKNTRMFGDMPLYMHTVQAAVLSGVFSDIQIWTDDAAVHMWSAEHSPARTFQRNISIDTEPDIDWVRVAIEKNPDADAFAILRPTSPLRTADTIKRAYEQFCHSETHSIRSMRLVSEHPAKMWQVENGCALPIMPRVHVDGTPWHSSPTQSLPKIYVQTGGLEMAWAYVPKNFGTISGTKIAPFLVEGPEALDINTEADWQEAERMIACLGT